MSHSPPDYSRFKGKISKKIKYFVKLSIAVLLYTKHSKVYVTPDVTCRLRSNEEETAADYRALPNQFRDLVSYCAERLRFCGPQVILQ